MENAKYQEDSLNESKVSAPVYTAVELVKMVLKKPSMRDREKTKHIKHAEEITIEHVLDIARIMSRQSKTDNFSGTVKEILSTCLSVGCTVDGEDPNKVITKIDNGDLELPEEVSFGFSSMETKNSGNSFEEDEDDLSMTDEEEALYKKSLEESEGFDVVYFPSGVNDLGIILPINIEHRGVLFYANMAIEVFNKSIHKEKEGELVFDKVLKAMRQAICGLRYYLTFNAKNLRHNEIRTYQAVVLCGSGRDDEVESFRAMPSGSKKEWIWVTHLSCC